MVDDDPLYRKLVQTILEKHNYDVITVNDGVEALPIVSRKPVQLVIMDLHMSEMNGFQATAELRNAGYQIPVVALTVETRFGIIEECLAAGMNDYLEKPIDKTKLLETLDTLLCEVSVDE